MSRSVSPPRIGIYGADERLAPSCKSGCPWGPGYAPVITAAGGTPQALRMMPGCSWDELLDGVDGVVFARSRAGCARQQAEEERLCEWCRELSLPFLGVDEGLHVLNTTFGGTLHLNLASDLPDALQHRHPPEPGVRHAITVSHGTRLAQCYGEGEIVVNSEHRRAVCRVARGFRVSGRALDGVIEAIEAETDGWFGLGVQWQPASATASGLDIQLFRGLVEACGRRSSRRGRAVQTAAA
jgi:gamma-glutamyl-gamma-aminobutyrate hydrolase PuuD